MWSWAIGMAIAGAMLAGVLYGGGYYSYLASIVGAIVAFPIGLVVGMAQRIGRLERELNDSSKFLLERIRSLEARLQDPEPHHEPAPTAPQEAGPDDRVEPEPFSAAAPEPEPAPAADEAPAAAEAEPIAAAPEPPEAPEPATAASPIPQDLPVYEPSRQWSWVTDFVSGENALVRLGLLVTFVGLAFLYAYGLEQRWIGVEWNYILVAAAGIAALFWGWRVREARPGFALLVQGGGVAVLYSTVFAAARLHGLLPEPLAFALMVAFVLLAAALAILQHAPALAAVAALGGYLVPLLLFVDALTADHLPLFAYFSLLNAGGALLAFLRGWRVPLLLGFLSSTLTAAAWGVLAYTPEHFLSSELFLLLYFLTFTGGAVVASLRDREGDLRAADLLLMFATPLAGFLLQAGLTRSIAFGPALSALLVAAYYVVLTRWLWRRGGWTAGEAALTLGVGFLTLAVPLAISLKTTSLVWAVEGAALIWLALRYRKSALLAVGLLLQILVSLGFLMALPGSLLTGPRDPLTWVAELLLALSLGFSAWAFHTQAGPEHARLRSLRAAFSLMALFWWLVAGAHGIKGSRLPLERFHAWMAWAAASLGLAAELGRRLGWVELVRAFLALPLLLLPTAAYGLAVTAHPFELRETWFWIPVLALWFNQLVTTNAYDRAVRSLGVAVGFTFALTLVSLEAAWWVDQLHAADTWRQLAWVWVPLLALVTLGSRTAQRRWPALQELNPVGLGLVAVWLALWLVKTTFSATGDPRPLPYLPVANPLELTQLLSIGGLLLWWLRDGSRYFPQARRFAGWVLGVVLFVWANAVIARATHHLGGVPFEWRALFTYQWFHTAVSILWGVVSLVLMVTGSRLAHRSLWQAGFGLYVLTVVKLFVVDLAGQAAVARIVSFLGVGLLLVLTGYFAPRPRGGALEEE